MTDPKPPAFRRLYIASLVSMVLFSASVTMPALCLQQIGGDFHLNLAARGILGSSRMAALLLGLMVTGYLADVVGKGAFLTVGMLLIGAGMAGLSVAGGYGGLVAASMIGGAGTGALEALVNPLVAELRPDNPARYLNLVNGAYSLGLVAVALLAGELLYAGVSWRPIMLIWAPPAVLGGLLFATRRYPRFEHPEGAAPARMAYLSRPLFWLLMGAIFIGGGVEVGMTFWGSSFLQRVLGGSARSGAWSVAFFGGFMALGRLVTSGLVSRVAPVRLMIASAAACALATACFWGVHTVVGAWALFGLGGLFVACFWPTILAVAADEVQAGSTSMFAMLAASGIGGCMIFPWAIGALGDLAGLRVGILILPAAMIVQVILLVAAWKRTRVVRATDAAA